MANALVTPKHITPEWYFEPFYAILRSIPNKLGGVVVMGLAIAVLAYLPFIDFNVTVSKYTRISQVFFWLFVANFICLGWLGTCPIEDPYILYSRICTFFYFAYFLIFLPVLAYIERLV
jgi:ubiquinol-cytochrome c reductase cytochrome b subunit